jgi:hypothetical protein
VETLGELAGDLPNLGTWRLFAVVEKSTNGGLLFGLFGLSRFWRTGWLGRQDSNLGMAESKSICFLIKINAHSENCTEFAPNPINRLVADSE